jgi:hypothetical protein
VAADLDACRMTCRSSSTRQMGMRGVWTCRQISPIVARWAWVMMKRC